MAVSAKKMNERCKNMSTYSEDMEVFEFSHTMNAFKAECSGFNCDDALAHLQQEEDTSGW